MSECTKFGSKTNTLKKQHLNAITITQVEVDKIINNGVKDTPNGVTT